MSSTNEHAADGAVSEAALARRANPNLTLYVLLAVYVLNFMDRQIVTVLAEPIKQELNLSDTQVGLLTGFSFALIYSIASIPIARLADRINRVKIIAIACATWSVFTGMTALVATFPHILLARMGVGIGEAGGGPPSASLITESMPANRRTAAMAVFSLGSPIGIALGTIFAGFIASRYGWRSAFIGAALIGVAVLPLLLLLKDPRQNSSSKGEGAPTEPLWQVVRRFGQGPMPLICIGSGANAFIAYGLLSWAPAFLMREKAMDPATLAIWYGPVAGASLALGGWTSGIIIQRLSARAKAWHAWIPMIAAFFTPPFILALIYAGSWQWTLAFLAVPLIANMSYLASCMTLVQEHIPLSARSTGLALYFLVINMAGLGAGPLVIGMISDVAASHGVASPLGVGLLALVPMSAVPIIAFFLLGRMIDRMERERA